MKINQFILTWCFIILFFNGVAAQTSMSEAVKLFNQGNYFAAKSQFEYAAKTDKSGEAWSYLGLIYTRQNDLKNANKAFQKSLKLNPRFVQSQIGLAYVYLLRNKDDDAADMARKVLKINENQAEANYILGVTDYREARYGSAHQIAEKVIKLNPQFAAAYLLKSESLAQEFGILSDEPNTNTPERRELLVKAAADLEKYIALASATNDVNEQRERAKSLNFLVEYYARKEKNPDEQTVYSKPYKILSKIAPGYTEKARTNGVSGTIKMKILLAQDGKVRYMFISKSLPDGLTEQAIRAAQQIRFEPAEKDGKPVSVVISIEYNFSIY